MVDLGSLGGGSSEAYSINNLGQVVGWATASDGYRHAFLWEELNDNGLSDWGDD